MEYLKKAYKVVKDKFLSFHIAVQVAIGFFAGLLVVLMIRGLFVA